MTPSVQLKKRIGCIYEILRFIATMVVVTWALLHVLNWAGGFVSQCMQQQGRNAALESEVRRLRERCQ